MRRANAIDFWRGFALIEIFINHVPDNGLWRLTHRQFSWSDAGELLVFLAGWSMALRVAARPGDMGSLVASRLMKLYVAHAVVTLLLVGIYWFAQQRLGDQTIFIDYHFNMELHGVTQMLIGALLLTEHVSYFNILPLYFVLTLSVIPMVWLACVSHGALLCASVGVYVLAQMGLSLDQWPSGRFWAFNPLGWQLIFVLGFVAGSRREELASRIDKSSFIFPAAIVIVVVSAICVRLGIPAPSLSDRGALEAFLFHKNNDGVVRVLQFMALAIVGYRLSPFVARLAPWAWSICSLLGRNSLVVFGASALVAGVGQVLDRYGFYGAVYDLSFASAAVLFFIFVASVREHLRERLRHRARPADFAPPTSATPVVAAQSDRAAA
jgi:hypothetical protein